jgi:DNA-binding MarR family transcriptional regulator
MTRSQFESLAEFRHQLRRFLRFSEEVTHEHGVTPLQYQLLLQLKGFPGRSHATVGALAQRLQAKHHGVVALVSRCEELGLVRRQPCLQDLRQVEVHLTRAGDARIAQLAALHRDELFTLGRLLDVPAVRHAAAKECP